MEHCPLFMPPSPQFADDCRTNGTAGRLRFVIEHFMTKALPHDAHMRCNGRTHIQLTRVFPYLKVGGVGWKEGAWVAPALLRAGIIGFHRYSLHPP